MKTVVLLILLVSIKVTAQTGSQPFATSGNGVPSGSCVGGLNYQNKDTSLWYKCNEITHLWETSLSPFLVAPIAEAQIANLVTDLTAKANIDLSNVIAGTVSVSNFPSSQPVTGTFWQGTQPVSLATNTPDVTDRSARLLGHVTVDSVPSTPVTGTFWQGTQPISASSLPLPSGAATSTKQSDGSQKTQVVDGSGNVIASTANALNVNVGNTVTATANQGGTWTDRVVGNAGGAFDAANNAVAPANIIAGGLEAQSGQPAVATTGNMRRLVGSVDGAIYTRSGGPVQWTCGLNALAATLTQCQPAPSAGLKLYITDISVQTTTATSGTYAIQYGTGASCGTGTTALFPVSGTANRFNAPINSQPMAVLNFTIPMSAAAANAICVIGIATNTISIQLSGFTAP